ncbi:hypothetical protein ACJX0J_035510 [Zea mays]
MWILLHVKLHYLLHVKLKFVHLYLHYLLHNIKKCVFYWLDINNPFAHPANKYSSEMVADHHIPFTVCQWRVWQDFSLLLYKIDCNPYSEVVFLFLIYWANNCFNELPIYLWTPSIYLVTFVSVVNCYLYFLEMIFILKLTHDW